MSGITGQSFFAGGSVFKDFSDEERGKDYWPKLRCRGICFPRLSETSVSGITGQSFFAGGSVFKKFSDEERGKDYWPKLLCRGICFQKFFG